MSIANLEFTKHWTDESDFPAKEPSETQVRADIQLLYDEIRDYINTLIVTALNELIPKVDALENLTIPDGSVTAAKLMQVSGVEAVVTAAVRAGAITAAKLCQVSGSEAVVTAAIRNGAVNEDKIDNGAVTALKLRQVSGSEAVVTAAIRNGAVTKAKLGTDIVPLDVGIKHGTAAESQIAGLLSEGQVYLKYS